MLCRSGPHPPATQLRPSWVGPRGLKRLKGATQLKCNSLIMSGRSDLSACARAPPMRVAHASAHAHVRAPPAPASPSELVGVGAAP